MLFRKQIVFLLFLFAVCLKSFSQESGKLTLLKTILFEIETLHQVTFNYTDENVNFVKIIPPDKNLSLQVKLNYIEKNTNLSFENIDDTFINIFKKKPSDPIKICGYVLSNLDFKPIKNVNIQYQDVRVVTNGQGYFEFRKKQKNDFLISHIGYESQKVILPQRAEGSCLKIILEAEITALAEIKTVPVLASGITKKNDGSFEIKPKKFGILPGLIEPDVLQTMQQIPGINSLDESVASINVRGGTHDQNLFLWNGIRMYQTGHFFGLISVFNPNLAHTISIYKNGSSAFYGESVSSVVDISSNPTSFENNSNSAGFNMINADVLLRHKLSKKSFIEISSRKSITDYLQTPTYNEYYNKAFQNTTITDFAQTQNTEYSSTKKFSFYDATFKYVQNIGKKDQLIMDLITISDNLNVEQKALGNEASRSEVDVLQQKNFGANLSWNRQWNKINATKINIHSSSYELLADKKTTVGDQIIIQKNTVLDNGISIENNHRVSPKFIFNNGYQWNEIGILNLDKVNTPQYYRKLKEVLKTHAVILEGKYNDSLSNIHCSTGVRINYVEKFQKTIVEPRIQLNIALKSNFSLGLLGELKSQNSHQSIELQQDYFGIEKRHWILSNDSTIPIQKSKQASLNLTYNKNNWFISLENFYKKVAGITSSSQGFQNQLEFEKINGDYEVLGTEVLIQKKINRFMTWLSYAYNDNNYHFPTYEYPTFPNNFEMDHNFTWAGMYEKAGFKIALGAKWSSGRPTTTPINTDINPDNPAIIYNKPNNSELGSFFQINLSSTYKWKSADGIVYNIGLSVLNLLNRKNNINEYYRISSQNNVIEDIKTFAVQRTPNINFRINL